MRRWCCLTDLLWGSCMCAIVTSPGLWFPYSLGIHLQPIVWLYVPVNKDNSLGYYQYISIIKCFFLFFVFVLFNKKIGIFYDPSTLKINMLQIKQPKQNKTMWNLRTWNMWTLCQRGSDILQINKRTLTRVNILTLTRGARGVWLRVGLRH